MIRFQKIIITVFILFFIQTSLSQQKENIILLLNTLAIIEEEYPVTFNYSDDLLETILVKKPETNLTISALLAKLFKETYLTFTILKDGQIIISKKVETEKITMLDEIIINNILTKGISIKRGGKITIKPADFEILPGLSEVDILQSIQSLLGVINVNKKLSDIDIRGGTHDQNLFLWNNIKMYQTGHFFC